MGGMVEKEIKVKGKKKTLRITDIRLTTLPQLTTATKRNPF